MYNNKPQHHKTPGKNSSRRAMFIFWLIASVLWIGLCANIFHMNKVVAAYKMYNHYEKIIQGGSKSNYARKAYLRSTDYTNELSGYVAKFFLLGLGMPGLLLALGTWMLRNSKD